MDKTSLVGHREALAGDRNFILATWLRGLYYGNTWFKEIPKNVFMENYHNLLDRLLASPTVKIKVACLKDDPDVILGYSVVSKDETIVHWVFCKSAWRGIGIARSLVNPQATVATHLTKVGLSLIKKCPGMIFNPFVI